MVGKSYYLFLILLLFFLPLSHAQVDPSERAYWDANIQKMIAQISQKIDTQTNKVELDMKSEMSKVKTDLKNELQREISSSLKNVSIGLAGLIIVTLAVFKVIDLRLTATKNLRRYEDELQKQKKEYVDIIAKAKQDSLQLLDYRNGLLKYHEELIGYEKGINSKPIPVQKPNPIPIPMPIEKKRWFSFKKKVRA